MKTPHVPILAATAAFATTPAPAADSPAWVTSLTSPKDDDRARAIDAAVAQGAAAVATLCPLLTDAGTEVRRAAKRTLARIVRHAGRPGAPKAEPRSVEEELLAALKPLRHAQAQREILWLLSEIGDDDTIQAMAPLLKDSELREDARCVLQRIPGRRSLAALKDALRQVPEEFRPALAESLRRRGEKIEQWPSQRLKPTKATSVKAG